MVGTRPVAERGAALVAAVLLTFLIAAIAIGVAVMMRIEVLMAAQHRRAAEALPAAEGGLHAVLSELRALPDWSGVVGGAQHSALSSGAFAGSRTVPGGGTVRLCCDDASAAGRLAGETAIAARASRQAIQWRPYLWTTFDALLARENPSGLFVIVWIGNDEEDRAGGSLLDTNHTVLVRSEAVAAGGLRRGVEALVAREPPGVLDEGTRLVRLHVLLWRDVR